MDKITPKIDASWLNVLQHEFEKSYFKEIKQYLIQEKNNGQIVYPPGSLIFSAFNQTPFDKVKVVILGQDPYHGIGQANGLSFSVSDGVAIPPSLKNIYKEIENDLKITKPNTGNLINWAKQGVFLLNSILTVKANQPASHQKIGWQIFTDEVIHQLSEKRSGIVFMLWGNYAKAKQLLINEKKHYILLAGHPSPLSERFFVGCKHFSTCNQLLINQNIEPINWSLT